MLVVDIVRIQLPPDIVLVERRVLVEAPVYLTKDEKPVEEKKMDGISWKSYAEGML